MPFVLRVGLASHLLLSADTFLTLDSLLGAGIYQETGSIEQATGDIPLRKTSGVYTARRHS